MSCSFLLFVKVTVRKSYFFSYHIQHRATELNACIERPSPAMQSRLKCLMLYAFTWTVLCFTNRAYKHCHTISTDLCVQLDHDIEYFASYKSANISSNMYAIRRNFLLLKRRSVLSKYEPDLDTTQNIHELGVPKSMRSTRAGSRKIRSIPTIITSQRRDNIHYQYGPNYSNLVMVANHDLHPCSNTIPVITTVRDTVVKKTHFKPTVNTAIHRVP